MHSVELPAYEPEADGDGTTTPNDDGLRPRREKQASGP